MACLVSNNSRLINTPYTILGQRWWESRPRSCASQEFHPKWLKTSCIVGFRHGIGLDVAAAHQILTRLRAGLVYLSSNKVEKLRRHLLRCNAELAVLSALNEFKRWAIDPHLIDKIALATGGRCRKPLSMGIPMLGGGRNRVVFATADLPPLDYRLAILDEVIACPISFAAAVFGEVIVSHPLSDGNGRLARALTVGALIRRGLLDRPIIPINTSAYLHMNSVGRAIRIGGREGNWLALRAAIMMAIETGHHLTTRLMDQSDRFKGVLIGL